MAAREGWVGGGIRAGEDTLLSSALDSVHALNERCLEVLVRRAQERPAPASRFLAALGPELRALDPLTVARVARQPFLLVDFGFGDPRGFIELASGHPTRRPLSPRDLLPEQEAMRLSRGALLLAQGVSRHHPAHAGLLLGLHPQLVEPVAALRLPQIERLAETAFSALSLRWESRPDVWRGLLATGEQGPEGQRQFLMQGIQLIAGEVARGA